MDQRSEKPIGAWKAPDMASYMADVRRTVYDIALGIQTAQGFATLGQVYRALEPYGWHRDCECCVDTIEAAVQDLERSGNFARGIYVG